MPNEELEICERLRKTREGVLKITQAACAKEIGLDRSTLANYETGRTPLPFEPALRFCRQFIISEEWLATGRHDALHAALPGNIAGAGDWKTFDEKISIRQCMDLFSEPARLHISSGTLFSKAFNDVLGSRYRELVKHSPFYPRIEPSDADGWDVAVNLLKVIYERHFHLLDETAKLRQIKPSDLWRLYLSRALVCCAITFKSFDETNLAAVPMEKVRWLRDILFEPPDGEVKNNGKEDLTGTSEMRKVEGVKSEIQRLLARVSRLVAAKGTKAKLAETLEVPQSRLSEWLGGKCDPSGETTLRLLRWVEQQERQK